VHVKSASAQEIRALLTARRLLLDKLRDVELSLRGILRGFGLKLGKVTQKGFETRVCELVANHPMLQQITGSMLVARATLQREHNTLHKALLKIVRRDNVCRQFMTVPSVGPIVAITYKTAVDDPHRIKKSKAVGPLFGLTPKRYQSGETDVIGGISRIEDAMVRAMLYEAANVLLSRTMRFSALKRWGLAVAKRRGMKRAKVAVARKIAVILHRMWIDGTSFRWSNEKAAAHA
jgi:transposase